MATQNPTRVELGDRFRRARDTAKLSTQVVENELGWYPGKVSRVERGERVPVPAEVDRLCSLYDVPNDERDTLRLLAVAARKREAPSRVADFAQTYVTLERAAVEIRYFDEVLIYGLLQTEAYARSVLANSHTQHVDERAADRVARQAILRRDDPPHVRVVLGEAALVREVGGKDVLRDQLRHLVEIGQLPNVHIRILPNRVGAHRALGVGFTHLRLTTPQITRVYIEGLTDATYIHERQETAVYERGFDDLWSVALDEQDSATIVLRHIGRD